MQEGVSYSAEISGHLSTSCLHFLTPPLDACELYTVLHSTYYNDYVLSITGVLDILIGVRGADSGKLIFPEARKQLIPSHQCHWRIYLSWLLISSSRPSD